MHLQLMTTAVTAARFRRHLQTQRMISQNCFSVEIGILIYGIFSIFCCMLYKFNVELRNKSMFMACEPDFWFQCLGTW